MKEVLFSIFSHFLSVPIFLEILLCRFKCQSMTLSFNLILHLFSLTQEIALYSDIDGVKKQAEEKRRVCCKYAMPQIYYFQNLLRLCL